MALGIYLDTWKEEHLKNDPDFRLTRKSYQAAMREFNSLSDDGKAPYVAEATKKMHFLENNTVPVRASRRVLKRRKCAKPRRDKSFDAAIEVESRCIFMEAIREEHWKNDPDFKFTLEAYYGGWKEFYSLNDEGVAPYIAEAVRTLADRRAEDVKLMAKDIHGML